jgi:hypothetical protein
MLESVGAYTEKLLAADAPVEPVTVILAVVGEAIRPAVTTAVSCVVPT